MGIIKNYNEKVKIDLDDLCIQPAKFTEIDSRSEITPYNNDGLLPIMGSPMNSLFSLTSDFNNYFDRELYRHRIPFAYTRGYEKNRIFHNFPSFVSVSLTEFEKLINDNTDFGGYNYILVDIANGHLKKLFDLSKRFKEIYGDSKKLMVGNVANPDTFAEYASIGVDYIRLSIGSGSRCITAANQNVHYGLASLIYDCYKIKKTNDFKINIVPDGGFRTYSDIITALALGADYVMLGGELSKFLEANHTPYLFNKIPINNIKLAKWLYNKNLPLYRNHIGMSTKKIQKLWKKDKLRTSEGIEKPNKITTDINKWTENFKDTLTGIMSYTNSTNLEEFKEKTILNINSQNVLNRFKK